MEPRTKLFAGLAAGAVVLGGAAWFFLRPRGEAASAVSTAAPVIPSKGPRVKRCRVHNKARVCPPLLPWVEEWEFSGEFDLQVPRGGGVRFDDEREPDGQRWIYAQGRTRPGSIVTNAQSAADSAHGHNAANDFYPVRTLDAAGNVATVFLGSPTTEDPLTYAEATRRFDVMIRHAEGFDLESGKYFPGLSDLPHLQHKSWRSFPVAIRPLA